MIVSSLRFDSCRVSAFGGIDIIIPTVVRLEIACTRVFICCCECTWIGCECRILRCEAVIMRGATERVSMVLKCLFLLEGDETAKMKVKKQ